MNNNKTWTIKDWLVGTWRILITLLVVNSALSQYLSKDMATLIQRGIYLVQRHVEEQIDEIDQVGGTDRENESDQVPTISE